MRIRFVSLLFLLMLDSFAFSQANNKKVKEVEQAIVAMRDAMVEGKSQALLDIVADDLSYGHSSGAVENKAEFVDKITSGKSDFVKIDLTNQTIKIVGNTAIVRHDLQAETNNNGTPGTVSLQILLIWQKQKGKWKLLARQAVKK
jgi:ketosteroid isomerase-like protein